MFFIGRKDKFGGIYMKGVANYSVDRLISQVRELVSNPNLTAAEMENAARNFSASGIGNFSYEQYKDDPNKFREALEGLLEQLEEARKTDEKGNSTINDRSDEKKSEPTREKKPWELDPEAKKNVNDNLIKVAQEFQGHSGETQEKGDKEVDTNSEDGGR